MPYVFIRNKISRLSVFDTLRKYPGEQLTVTRAKVKTPTLYTGHHVQTKKDQFDHSKIGSTHPVDWMIVKSKKLQRRRRQSCFLFPDSPRKDRSGSACRVMHSL